MIRRTRVDGKIDGIQEGLDDFVPGFSKSSCACLDSHVSDCSPSDVMYFDGSKMHPQVNVDCMFKRSGS